jgi:hypothetical protein
MRFPAKNKILGGACACSTGFATPSPLNMKGVTMTFMTQKQRQTMLENGKLENRDKDHVPVIKLFLPGTACTWLLTELNPEEQNIAFGLCDLGMGFPELGYVDLDELAAIRVRNIFRVERDVHFKGEYPISAYAQAARNNEAITESTELLQRALTPS